MKIEKIVRRLTGAARNAVVWGAAWSALAFVTILGLRATGVVVPAEITVLDAIGMAVRVGIAGGMAGGVFALFISRFYRGRRLAEINPVRFGLGGAVVAELFLLAFFAIGNLASGDGFPGLEHILSDLIIAAVFGFVAAGASMWLAQHTDTRSIGGLDRYDGLPAGSTLPGAEDAVRRDHARARR